MRTSEPPRICSRWGPFQGDFSGRHRRVVVASVERDCPRVGRDLRGDSPRRRRLVLPRDLFTGYLGVSDLDHVLLALGAVGALTPELKAILLNLCPSRKYRHEARSSLSSTRSPSGGLSPRTPRGPRSLGRCRRRFADFELRGASCSLDKVATQDYSVRPNQQRQRNRDGQDNYQRCRWWSGHSRFSIDVLRDSEQ